MDNPEPRHDAMDLSTFDPTGLVRGRSRALEVAWWLVKLAFIRTNFPWPSRLKAAILRLFGAQVGDGLYIRPGVDIHFPWKLNIGSHVWIGQGCTLLNLEPITLEDNCALAHEVYLAAANHDIRDTSFAYKNRPIVVRSGAWVASRAFIGPGVIVGRNAVVAAGAVVTQRVADDTIVQGNPATVVGRRVSK